MQYASGYNSSGICAVDEPYQATEEQTDVGHKHRKGSYNSKCALAHGRWDLRSKWGRKYGITTPEQGEAVEAMEQGLDQEEAEPKKKSILELLKP